MTRLTTHGCGKSWKQRGNRTSHCGGCHVTFEGLSLFDAHFVHHKDGTLTHLDPRTMKFNKAPLVFDGSLGDGVWKRSDLSHMAFEGRTGAGRVSDAGDAQDAAEPHTSDVREAVAS